MSEGYTISRARGQLRPATGWRGPGRMDLVKIPNPATGQSFIRQTPGDFWERLLAVSFTLTTSGTAGQRELNFLMQDGDSFTFNITPLASPISPNQTVPVALDRDAPSPAQLPTSLVARGSVTSPAASATIASTPTGQSGEYLVSWSVELEGTVAAATDNDNFALFFNGNQIAQSQNQGAVGVYPQLAVTIEAAAANAIIVKSINLATVGAIYVANISAQPVANLFAAGQLPDIWLKSGWQTQIQIINVQAGDAITNLAYLVERVPSADIYQEQHHAVEELAGLLLAYMQGG